MRKIKYKSILQVLNSANDIISKYNVIENLVDGLVLEAEKEIKKEINQKQKERQIKQKGGIENLREYQRIKKKKRLFNILLVI